jgi:hypothetical protein
MSVAVKPKGVLSIHIKLQQCYAYQSQSYFATGQSVRLGAKPFETSDQYFIN